MRTTAMDIIMKRKMKERIFATGSPRPRVLSKDEASL